MKIIVNEYDSKIQTHLQADETRMNVEVPQLHQASATEDGSYVTLGHCRKECLAKLPAVPFAVPKAAEPPAEGWLSGADSCLPPSVWRGSCPKNWQIPANDLNEE